MADIGKALSYQIKKEIAERYFTYRTIIEEDQLELEKLISRCRDFFETNVRESLMRIYILLQGSSLTDEFMKLISWEEKPFIEDCKGYSEEDQNALFEGFTKRGLTSSSRKQNLFLDCYSRLYDDVRAYKGLGMDVKDEAEVINQEIAIFKEKFSLDEILIFIRTLDKTSDLGGILGENLPSASQTDIEERLEIKEVPDPEEMLPRVPEIPPVSQIKRELKEIAKKAYKQEKG